MSAAFTQATLILKTLADELNSRGMCKSPDLNHSLIFPRKILQKKKQTNKQTNKQNQKKNPNIVLQERP